MLNEIDALIHSMESDRWDRVMEGEEEPSPLDRIDEQSEGVSASSKKSGWREKHGKADL